MEGQSDETILAKQVPDLHQSIESMLERQKLAELAHDLIESDSSVSSNRKKRL